MSGIRRKVAGRVQTPPPNAVAEAAAPAPAAPVRRGPTEKDARALAQRTLLGLGGGPRATPTNRAGQNAGREEYAETQALLNDEAQTLGGGLTPEEVERRRLARERQARTRRGGGGIRASDRI